MPCTIPGCLGFVQSKGLCKSCYDAARRQDPAVAARRKARETAKKAEDPNYHRRNNLKRYQGMTLGMFEEISWDQNTLCYICEDSPEGEGPAGILHVDHCHKTGNVRRLLCHGCNTALGAFEENTNFMESAIQYLLDNGAAEELPEAAF